MTRPYKTILVALNNGALLDSSMAMAAKIARAHDSHIIGLYVIPSAIIYSAPYGYGGAINFTESNRFYRERATGIAIAFNDFVRKEGLKGEWREISSSGHFVSDAIIEHGREADLIILGHDDAVEATQPDIEFNSNIIAASGRPVLMVPKSFDSGADFGKIVIGWDGSREAARSAFDAIPLMMMADVTQITCFNSDKEREIGGDLPGSELATSIARYDVNAIAVQKTTKGAIGEALIGELNPQDLLIIGAYGHTRLRESILGGVTRNALTQSKNPVFMSN